MAIRIADGKEKTVIPVNVGTGGLANGSMAVTSSNTAVKATSPVTAATALGTSIGAYDASSVGYIETFDNHILRCDFTGSSKTTLVDADIGKIFDISDDVTVNLDDTTGGCFMYVGNADNTNKQADFRLVESFKAI